MWMLTIFALWPIVRGGVDVWVDLVVPNVRATNVGAPRALSGALDTSLFRLILYTVEITGALNLFSFCWRIQKVACGTLDLIATPDRYAGCLT